MAPLKNAAARLYMACALPLGLAYAVLNAPFAVPQELGHLGRAYEIASGVFVPRSDAEGGVFLEVPLDYVTARAASSALQLDPDARIDSEQLWDALSTSGRSAQRSRTSAPVRLSTPLPYLHYVPALWLARALGLSPLWDLYFARVAGVVAHTLLAACAIALSGRLAWLSFALASIPIALTNAGGVSPDAMVHALTLLFFALALRIHNERERASNGALPLAAACLTGLLTCIDPKYLLLAAALPALTPSEPPRKRYRLFFLTLVGSAALLALFRYAPGAPPSAGHLVEGFGWLLSHPARALHQLRLTVFRRGDDAFLELFAVHDVLTEQVRFAATVIAVCYTQLLALLSTGALRAVSLPGTRTLQGRLVAIGIALGFVTLALAYGEEGIENARLLSALHGDHLTPLLPFACVALLHARPVAAHSLTRGGGRSVVLIVVALNLFCLLALYGRYHASPQFSFPT